MTKKMKELNRRKTKKTRETKAMRLNLKKETHQRIKTKAFLDLCI